MDGHGLSNYSSIYADGKIEEPIYDHKTNKFLVRYHVGKEDHIKWKEKYFENKLEAIHFYTRKYEEYVYEWTLMFYRDFKPIVRYSKGSR